MTKREWLGVPGKTERGRYSWNQDPQTGEKDGLRRLKMLRMGERREKGSGREELETGSHAVASKTRAQNSGDCQATWAIEKDTSLAVGNPNQLSIERSDRHCGGFLIKQKSVE